MRIGATQIREVFEILEAVEDGKAPPQLPGHIGRFLRQYGQVRAKLNPVLTARGMTCRADGAVSGRFLGAITVQQMFDPEIRFRGRQLGEVAESIVSCEDLGCLQHLAMWTKGETAKSALDLLRHYEAVQLTGDYRWTPPSRITPGEAHLLGARSTAGDWRSARFLKSVSDDLARPPHALEYLRDRRKGELGLKFFRCICGLREGETWHVLPGLGHRATLRISGRSPQLGDHDALALLLISRQPWSDSWTIEDAAAITPDEALAHAITWADFQRELYELPLDARIVAALRESLYSAGVRPVGLGEPTLFRSLLPVGRDLLRHLRGLGTAASDW